MRGRWVLLAALSVCWQLQWSSAAERGLPGCLASTSSRPALPWEDSSCPVSHLGSSSTPVVLDHSSAPPEPAASLWVPGEEEEGKEETFCGKEGCLGTRQVLETFGNLFTPDTPGYKNRATEAATKHDNDQCCPTMRYFTTEETMLDTNGQLRTIIHLDKLSPPRYQWYQAGTCADVESRHCTGRCVVEYCTIWMLVREETGPCPFAFDSFSVPCYCSCKGI